MALFACDGDRCLPAPPMTMSCEGAPEDPGPCIYAWIEELVFEPIASRCFAEASPAYLMYGESATLEVCTELSCALLPTARYI